MGNWPEKIIVVPDTHGHLREVEGLVKHCNNNGYLADHRLVFLGDYFDRGPNAKGLIDFCVELQKHGHIFLRGNHEYTLLMAMHPQNPVRDIWIERWARKYESRTLKSYGLESPRIPIWSPGWIGDCTVIGAKSSAPKWTYCDNFSLADWREVADQLRSAMPIEHRVFLSSLANYYETDNFIFLHAGVTMEDWSKQLRDMRLSSLAGPSQLFSSVLADSIRHSLNKVVVTGHTNWFKPRFFQKRVQLSCGIDIGGPLVGWVIDKHSLVTIENTESSYFSNNMIKYV